MSEAWSRNNSTTQWWIALHSLEHIRIPGDARRYIPSQLFGTEALNLVTRIWSSFVTSFKTSVSWLSLYHIYFGNDT
ncbi:Hypothetical predicted protein [Paramuricea clavata]|uniref:Uncharacterized protein n=1 Tax=Paramuricea clavata TaxID=317549 RepID=A0A6S7JD51_PARCT|nr:Hypothetical predicted protein [Paramuricea clavata]